MQFPEAEGRGFSAEAEPILRAAQVMDDSDDDEPDKKKGNKKSTEEELTTPEPFTAMAVVGTESDVPARGDAFGNIATKPTDEYYTTCKIRVEVTDVWSSSIRVDFKLMRRQDPKVNPIVDVVKQWDLRLYHDCGMKSSPLTAEYTRKIGPKDEIPEQFFLEVCGQHAAAWETRRHGHLVYMELTFDPARAHTEGILMDPLEPLPHEFQAMQDRLFTSSDSGRHVLYAAVVVTLRDGFELSLKNVTRAWETDRNEPRELKWFADPKFTIQKGQMAPRDEQPQVILRSRRTFRSTDEYYLTEGGVFTELGPTHLMAIEIPSFEYVLLRCVSQLDARSIRTARWRLHFVIPVKRELRYSSFVVHIVFPLSLWPRAKSQTMEHKISAFQTTICGHDK